MEESECVRLAAAGDLEAFGLLYQRYFGSVAASVGRILKNRHDAEDAVQDTFLTARRRLVAFRGEGSFEGWLRRIGVNCALDSLERRGRMEPTAGEELEGLPEDAPPAGGQLDGEVFQAAFQRALARLPAEFREAFSLAVLGRTPYDEAALAVGISRELLKVRVFRARKMLQESLRAFIK